MKHVDKFGLVIIVWLCLTGWLPISAKAGNSVEITSLKQLQVFLSSSTLKSDAVEDLNITANGILVDQTVSVESGTFRMHGGPLIRAEGFTETMLDIQEGANLTVENTIDGANIEAANKPLINIQKGGTFILSESGSLARASWISTDERTTIATPIPNPKEEFVILQSFVVSNNGTFIMDGGTISENTGGLTLLNNYSSGIFTFKKGSIKNNSCSTAINNVGTFNLYPNSFEISATGSIRLNTPMNILSSLNKPLNISVELKEGNIVAKGSGNYSLSQSDLSQLSISEIDKTDLILKLNNNQILLATSSDPGTSEITTPEELQKAIDKATGTADSPTIITIPKEGIRLTSPLIIEGKYIKLTGGTIWNNMTEATRMFELKSGKLILENITLDGYCSPTSAPQFCTFVFLLDGEFIMKEGAILQNAKCHWDGFNAVVVRGGHFYMEGGLITKNTCELGGLIYVGNKGSFTMKGGDIYDNTIGQWGTVYAESNFWYYGGNITHNNVDCVYIKSNFIINGGNSKYMIDAIKLNKGGKILLTSKLNISLYIIEFIGDFSDGDVIIQGSDGYIITEADLSKITIAKESGYTLKLVDNTIVVVKTQSGEITTPEDLQKAIDAAPEGSVANPTTITVSQAGIDFTKTVIIKGKHIKITANNGSFRNTITDKIQFFDVQSGSLTLENVIMQGTVKGINNYCSFAKVTKGASLTMVNVVMEKAISDEESFSLLRIYGTCTLKNCIIRNNTGKCMLYIAKGANCSIEGGEIKNNICSDSKYTYGLIYNWGTLDYISGECVENHAISFYSWGTTILRSAHIKNYLSTLIKDEGSCMLIYKELDLYSNGNTGDSFYMEKNNNDKGCINIMGQIKNNLEIVIHEPEDKWIIAKGSNYTLTQSDFQKFKLYSSIAKEWTLKLESNTIILSKTGSSSEIDTQEKLQAAIDASKGSVNSPVTITIANKDVLIYKSILIKDKYVKLTGGTLKNSASADLRMFDIRSGYLGLTNITLDGDKKNTSGYCTLIEMNGGSCEILDGTKLTNTLARGGSDAVIVIPQGKLTFRNGEISGNTSEGGDIIWVSGSGNFNMQGGSIKNNTNSGKYIMAGIQMTNGSMSLNGGQISDNIGNRYGVYVTKPFTLGSNADLKEVVMLSGESKLLIPSALKNKVTIGFMKSNMPSGTIVASGASYQLTSTDVQKFAYRYSNTYNFKLDNNNIVIVNLDAQNKTFSIKTINTRGGTLSVNKTTAKENELITVVAKPESGMKLYADGLRYNNNKLTSTNQENTYTFKMPPANVEVTTQFIPSNINIKPDNGDADPDKDPTSEITDLPGLIDRLKGGKDIDPSVPTDLIPQSTAGGDIIKIEPLQGLINTGKKAGDDFIGSIEQLISIVSKAQDGTTLKTKVLNKLPGKTTLRVYLPSRLIVSEQLRTSGSAKYYILNECDGNITRINPTFDSEENTLTFDTDKLGTFVIMNGSSSTANEMMIENQIIITTSPKGITIEGLPDNEYYSIYDLSGKLLKRERKQEMRIHYKPNNSGVYILQHSKGAQKIYFIK